MVTLIIPLAPMPKARPRVVNGRAYTPAATAAYERSIKLAAAHLTPVEGPLAVSIAFIFPRLKSSRSAAREIKSTRPDVDNLIKAVLDALNGLAFHDDGQVAQVAGSKWIAAADEEAHIEVTIEPINLGDMQIMKRRERGDARERRREQNRSEHREAQQQRHQAISESRKEERRQKLVEVEQRRADKQAAERRAREEALKAWIESRRRT